MADSFLKSLIRTTTSTTQIAKTVWSFLSTGAKGGIGYGTGAGGTVTQATGKTTAFTLDTMTGTITFNNSALAGFCTSSSATWTCSGMATGDVAVFNQIAGSLGAYQFTLVSSAGQGQIVICNTSSASLSEAVAVSFAIIKGATS